MVAPVRNASRPRAGLTISDAEGQPRVEMTTPRPWLDNEALARVERGEELDAADVERSIARPRRESPLITVRDERGGPRVALDARTAVNETETDEEIDTTMADVEATATGVRRPTRPPRPRNGFTVFDGFGRERATIETTEEVNATEPAEVEVRPPAGSVSTRPATTRPSFTRPPSFANCRAAFCASRPYFRPANRTRPTRPMMQFRDPRGVSRVTVDAGDEDEEDDSDVIDAAVAAPTRTNRTTPRRMSGIGLRDRDGRDRLSMATEPNVTTRPGRPSRPRKY